MTRRIGECAGCGVPFSAIRGTQRFCSRRCAARSQLRPRLEIARRFWPKVSKSDGCWLWIGTINSATGYGQIFSGVRGKHFSAHRAAWVIHFGEVPPGKFVCHRCDVKACVRPDHLYLGTNSQNILDAVARGLMRFDSLARKANSPRGVRHGMAKLAEDDVRKIRKLSADGWSLGQICEVFGVTKMTVHNIRTGKNWSHVK